MEIINIENIGGDEGRWVYNIVVALKGKERTFYEKFPENVADTDWRELKPHDEFFSPGRCTFQIATVDELKALSIAIGYIERHVDETKHRESEYRPI